MEVETKCFISLSQLVLPENVDSLTAERDDLRVQTFSTVEGAQKFIDKLKLLYNDPVRLLRPFWDAKAGMQKLGRRTSRGLGCEG
jgi:hypothetical protein